MSEHYDYSELRAEIETDPDRAELVRARTDALKADYEEYRATLGQLRRARDLTQTQLAEILNITQPEVSRIERQTDLYLSTLRNYVRAMGGRLGLAATFDTSAEEHAVVLRVGDVTEADARSELPTISELRRAESHVVFDLDDSMALGVIDGTRRHDMLRRSADQALSAGATNLACVLNAMAAEVTAHSDVDEDIASRAYGGAGAFARKHGKHKMAAALWRRSIDIDPTNMRSRSCLGQSLHHIGRHADAIEHLELAANVDNHARLFYGWSLLLDAVDSGDSEQHQRGLNELIKALHSWAYNAGADQRFPWLRHVQRLAALGSQCEVEAANLLGFATSNAKWGPLGPEVLRIDGAGETAMEADGVSEQEPWDALNFIGDAREFE